MNAYLSRFRRHLLVWSLWLAPIAIAQAADPATMTDVVVLATRHAATLLDVPASVDRVDADALRDSVGVNLSDDLESVPGVSAQNRQNYAQDLQLSIRGFGARSSFGTRGIRLYADGVPATLPDGQGQSSHFDLSGADHLEVLRGPFSALYGNASGGVIAITTADAPAGGSLGATADFGSFSTQRYALRAGSGSEGANYTIDAAHFSTDGYRDHSHAERNTANGKARWQLGERTRLTVVGNVIETPDVQDPLGLTAAQAAQNPQQVVPVALQYNTRKSLAQEQMGATLVSQLTDTDELTATSYIGHRQTTQYQAILKSVELASKTNPGGVIDLARNYRGGELRLADHSAVGGTSLDLTGGVSFDVLEEARRGYLNFDAAGLGDLGGLRRDEGNRVQNLDEYLQAEWQPSAHWRWTGGVRHTDVNVVSHDHLVNGVATTLHYGATNPVIGVTYRIAPSLSWYGSFGRGFETPTLNDIAYRSTDGSLPGLNTGLSAASSQNYETGVKYVQGPTRVALATFYIRTQNELAVKANSGGRSVLENIGPTDRRGLELSADRELALGWKATFAYTLIDARTLDPYVGCEVTPCVAATIPAGSRLPAVPRQSGNLALTWRPVDGRFHATVDTVERSRMYADDLNLATAAGYWTTNIRAGFEQHQGSWHTSETLRVDNLWDRRYVGTVIVNETNRRYFEPSPGRTVSLILNAAFQ
jgi:iron complex outermembrane recepter protein